MLREMDVLVLLDLLGAPRPRVLNFFPQTSTLYDSLRRTETRLRARGSLSAATATAGPMLVSAAPVGRGRPADGVQDDHVPFLIRGVPVLHLIPVPFPDVWHTPKDDLTALDAATVADWGRILTVFVYEYLDMGAAPAA